MNQSDEKTYTNPPAEGRDRRANNRILVNSDNLLVQQDIKVVFPDCPQL